MADILIKQRKREAEQVFERMQPHRSATGANVKPRLAGSPDCSWIIGSVSACNYVNSLNLHWHDCENQIKANLISIAAI